MKVYIVTTGVIFAMITVAHLVRIYFEPDVLREPLYNFLTFLSAALSIWAWRLFRRLMRRETDSSAGARQGHARSPAAFGDGHEGDAAGD
jgi:hypothetical protein